MYDRIDDYIYEDIIIDAYYFCGATVYYDYAEWYEECLSIDHNINSDGDKQLFILIQHHPLLKE